MTNYDTTIQPSTNTAGATDAAARGTVRLGSHPELQARIPDLRRVISTILSLAVLGFGFYSVNSSGYEDRAMSVLVFLLSFAALAAAIGPGRLFWVPMLALYLPVYHWAAIDAAVAEATGHGYDISAGPAIDTAVVGSPFLIVIGLAAIAGAIARAMYRRIRESRAH